MAGDSSQIVGNHRPAHPALKPVLAGGATSGQAEASFEHGDTAFNPIVPFAPPANPGLLFVLLAFFCPVTRLGQHDPFDAPVRGVLLVVLRIDAPVSAGLRRGLAEERFVGVQAVDPLQRVVGIAFQDYPTRDGRKLRFRAALDLVEPHLMPILDRLARLAACKYTNANQAFFNIGVIFSSDVHAVPQKVRGPAGADDGDMVGEKGAWNIIGLIRCRWCP